MKNVLVTAGSKHGATAEIAATIARTLAEHGLDVTLIPVEDVSDADPFDAVVVGSGVYAGHWLKPARDFLQRNAKVLEAKPVWLFSSGPVGDPPKPAEDPVDAAAARIGATRGHRVFCRKAGPQTPDAGGAGGGDDVAGALRRLP